MTTTNKSSERTSAAQVLRNQAEEIFRQKMAKEPKSLVPLSAEEIQVVVHELQTHQIELELQNEELRNVLAELDASRECYFDFYDLAPVGYSTISEKGVLLTANLTFASMLGAVRSELTDQLFSRFVKNEDQDIYYLFHKSLFRTGDARSCQLRMVKNDETTFWGHLIAITVQGSVTSSEQAGGARICRVVLSDISTLKQKEVALKLSEQRRSLALESANAGTWEWDLQTNKNTWSDELWRLYGLEPFCCKPSYTEWQNIVHPNDLAATEQIIKNAVRQGVAFGSEWRVKLNDGKERWLMSRGKPFKDPHDQIVSYLGTVIDISDRKRIEEQNTDLQSQLVQAQKMEAVGTLAGGIAHDFNNILGAVIGYAEMAREDSPPNSNLSNDLDQVLAASKRAADLVKQILLFSRQDITERIAVEPTRLVQEAIKLLRPALPSTITITQEFDITTQAILIDPTQFHQILMNLCTNAFHAMERNGGDLQIFLKEKNLSQQDLTSHPKVQAGRFIELSIADTGPGITREIRDKIFDPYFTTKEVGKGTGLGLAIVSGIVTASGGVITCESEPGKGTIFRVFFPVVESKMVSEAKHAEIDLSGTEHILLVDDEEVLVRMGQVMLERLGYVVTTRTNSFEALVTFKNQPDRFDAVITDQTMPGITGSDLSRMILKIRPDIPIILCTGFSSLINAEQARAFGIREFAMKPLVKKELAKLLRKVLDNKR